MKIDINDRRGDFAYENTCELGKFDKEGKCTLQNDCPKEVVPDPEYFTCYDPEIHPREPVFAHVWGLDRKYVGIALVEEVKGDDLPERNSEGVLYGFSQLSRLMGHPRLTLHDGTVMYGVECWWGSVKQSTHAPPETIDLTVHFAFMQALIDEAKAQSSS